MKRLIGFLMALCLLLGCVGPAFAKLEITEQPVTQTVPEKGKVTFSFNVSGQKSITWVFVNPETGEETTARNISKLFKGLKVNNPNSKKMTLRNVPAGLHGWSLFARCKAGGATVETDIVQILIEGKDIPSPSGMKPVASQPAEEAEQGSAGEEADATEEENAPAENPAPAEAGSQDEGNEIPAESSDANLTEEQMMSDELAEDDPPASVVTITGKDVLLYQIDAKGQPVGDGQSTMTFADSAAFHVRPAEEGEIQYWLFGDLRVEPAEAVSGFTLRGVTSDLTVSVKQKKTSASATENLDYDHPCKITCSNCFFTFLPSGLSYATEGEVPAGAKITVIAGQGADLGKGYTINGASGQQGNKVTFTFTVQEDTVFSMP